LENGTDKEQKSHEPFDIEGIGEFRAKKGTAIHELAGAASYWERECKTIEARLTEEFSKVFAQSEKTFERVSKTKWRDGFLTGAVSTAALTILTIVSLRLFW